MSEKLILSSLPKTWLIDIDGTIVEHNGHLRGDDKILDGVQDLFAKIAPQDKVIFLTARKKNHEEKVREFFAKFNIRCDAIIFDLPTGERILINDKKPSGLHTAIAVNVDRDSPLMIDFVIDEKI